MSYINVVYIPLTYIRLTSFVSVLQEKRYWRRYIYLWLNYALYEELSAIDLERTRQVYRFCLKLIPHRRFTFAKIWLYAAKFEIRQKKLTDARKLLVGSYAACLFSCCYTQANF